MAKKRKSPPKFGAGEIVPGVLIKGSDGGLYLIREGDLGPFKLSAKQKNELSKILGDVDLTMPKLSPDVVKQVQDYMDCIQLKYPGIEL